MCYGGLDPKYQTREIDARVKTYGFEPVTLKEPVGVPAPGLMARVRGVMAWLLRKDARDV